MSACSAGRPLSGTAALVAALSRETRALDPDVPLYDVRTMDEHAAAALTPQRLLAYLVSGFGSLALLLAAIGIYGLLVYAVTERTAEIGVRVAFGAQKADVMRLFVADGMTLRLARTPRGACRPERRASSPVTGAPR